MRQNLSSDSILDLNDLKAGPLAPAAPKTFGPAFSRSNCSASAVVAGHGRLLIAQRGEPPALVEIDLDEGNCAEVDVRDQGFRLGFGAFRATKAFRLNTGGLPHFFGDACLLRESGDWIAGGRTVSETGRAYTTFKDGDVVRMSLRDDALRVDRVRAGVVAHLGTLAPPGGGPLRPYVLLQALSSAAVALAAPRAPWSCSPQSYPAAFKDAAELVDRAAV
eukprot:CAMPEP_0119288602 /NCGR_PEP_ID=MMETSP1329-20130426/37561_1 /TAXON_ID=114041 /ORGANISM="Genus nov. species nov., Strain RCC1024" /LENGTH=219 /DNA_ID=CAMNT_0007289385 /DNA_START=147 /DNA_END=803 /DNA_ORIENTATION=-